MATFLIQGLEDTIGKGVSSWFDNVSEEHGLTEDGKTVAPIFMAFGSKSRSTSADLHPDFRSLHQD